MKYQILLLSFFAATLATAQELPQPEEGFSGHVTAQSGTGSANPWDGQIDLQYRNKQVYIRPFAGITGISRSSSEREEELNLQYRSGTDFQSNSTYEKKGTQLQYGTDLGFNFSPKSTLKAGIKVTQDDLKSYGYGHINVNDLADYYYELYGPKQDRKEHQITASFEQVLNPQHKLIFDYSYDQTETRKAQNKVYESASTSIPDWVYYDAYAYLDNADIDIHTLGAAWNYQSKHRWSIKSGVNYLVREINSECQEAYVDAKTLLSTDLISAYVNYPNRNVSFSSSNLTHEMKTLALTSDLTLPLLRSPFGLPWRILLHLEYDYTTMEGSFMYDKTLHDFVPRAIVVMPLNSTQTLTASYVRRIIRPEWEMLNPFSFDDKFTTRYGNMELEGIHANVVNLDYKKLFARGQFTTTVNHLFTNDGFNEMWMLQQNKRVYTWGNEGERNAWSVTPSLQLSPSEQLSLRAKATLLWDKRVASAISMEKEHWGITAEASATATLPSQVQLDLHGVYSEGNTVDLYSHETRSYRIGASATLPLFKHVSFLLCADYRTYARYKVTQGAYIGTISNAPANHLETLAKVIVSL